MVRLLPFALLGLAGVAVGIAWGWGAFLVFAFFAAIAGAVGLAAAVGGAWFTGASRGRFDRRDR